MTYATQQDMVDRYGAAEVMQITDLDGAGAIDATVLGRALSDADQVIDGYLAARYTLPLAPVPGLVVQWACDIARYRLWKDEALQIVKDRYDDAVAALKDVALGRIRLQVDGQAQAEAPSAASKVIAAPRVFTRDRLRDFLR